VYPTLLHVCGLVRKSCDEQYEELRQLGIYAQPISIKTNGEDYLNDFNKQKGKKTGVIVLDELDYATLATTAKVLRILRLIDYPNNTVGADAKLEVVINLSLYGTQNAGV
jgi:hypothetical protein